MTAQALTVKFVHLNALRAHQAQRIAERVEETDKTLQAAHVPLELMMMESLRIALLAFFLVNSVVQELAPSVLLLGHSLEEFALAPELQE
jgi:hypothetical protein